MYFHLRSVYLTQCILFVPAHGTRESPWTLIIQGFYAASTSKVSDVSKRFCFPTICLSTRRNIPEDLNLKRHCWQNLNLALSELCFGDFQFSTWYFTLSCTIGRWPFVQKFILWRLYELLGTAYVRVCVLSDLTHLTYIVVAHKFSKNLGPEGCHKARSILRIQILGWPVHLTVIWRFLLGACEMITHFCTYLKRRKLWNRNAENIWRHGAKFGRRGDHTPSICALLF